MTGKLLKISLGLMCVVLVAACTPTPRIPLGQEQVPKGEDATIQKISVLLSNRLKEQYAGQKMLRDTHPKANACIRGTFEVDKNIPAEFSYGVFQPGAQYATWMRFSNSLQTVTSDYEKDFRGLGIKLTGVEGERVAGPGDEQHTQDFLLLGHDAFVVANPEQFLNFFEAQFSGKAQTAWFFLTHPQGLYNLLTGEARVTNPLNIHWNSVTGYGVGNEQGDAFNTVVRYAVQTCPGTTNGGEAPDEAKPNYLTPNMQTELHNQDACLDFFVQKQVDPVKMPVENALVQWDQKLSPFIKIARIHIPKQTFTSEAQMDFCENLSFNPGHALLVHQPLGGINRARMVVMKAISDLRLMENHQQRTEPTGDERFE